MDFETVINHANFYLYKFIKNTHLNSNLFSILGVLVHLDIKNIPLDKYNLKR